MAEEIVGRSKAKDDYNVPDKATEWSISIASKNIKKAEKKVP
jgi:hypothetical protein